MANAFEKYVNTLPRIFKPATNPVIRALMTGVASEADNIAQQILNARDQLFVKTATKGNLTKVAKSLGVNRPVLLGLTDEDFRTLVPNLSLKPKQIKKAFYDTADVFWGPTLSRANIMTGNFAPFAVSAGDTFLITVDGGTQQSTKVRSEDVVIPGAMTAAELVTFLNLRVDGVTAQIESDAAGDDFVNLRTNTPGSVGSILVSDASTMINIAKVDFPTVQNTILDLTQRFAVYNVTANKLTVEIPVVISALRRTLKGSHHFHLDGTLELPKPTENGIWHGSFLWSGANTGGFTISSEKVLLQQNITKGTVAPTIAVDDASGFSNTSGQLVFNFGLNSQEQPVAYRGIPNSSTLLLDPAHVFAQNHLTGAVINVLRDTKSHTPARSGDDFGIYLPSPSGGRVVVENILSTLKAAGIIIEFVVLSPDYKYLIDNPYLTDDQAPEC